MAESNSSGAPGQLDTNIESGKFDEKEAPINTPTHEKVKAEGVEEEDEDMDALIEDLESHDGHDDEDEDEVVNPGSKLSSSPPCPAQHSPWSHL
jgi:H+-transporting ATPase